MRTVTMGTGKTFLDLDQLRKLDSIFSHEAIGYASKGYNFINSASVVEKLAERAWLPVKATQQNVAPWSERDGYQKHMIRFRERTDKPVKVGDCFPEIVMINSHDTRVSWRFMLGLFRLICLNGMIVSKASFLELSFNHLYIDQSHVNEIVDKTMEGSSKLNSNIIEYKERVLGWEERLEFGRQSLEVKYIGKSEVREQKVFIGEREVYPKVVITARRSEDAKDISLWGTFNVVQENLLKGGRDISSGRAIREIEGIDETLRLNQGIWSLLEEWKS